MDSNTAPLTPEQLDLVKFGSLGSNKLRRLYFNSVKSNTSETSKVDPNITAIDTIGSKPVNSTNTNIDVKLNLDLDNYLQRALNTSSKSNTPSVSYSLGNSSTGVTRRKSRNSASPNPSESPEYKKLNDKNYIEKEWSAIGEAEPTHTALREWKSIQLRGFVDPKRFYKNMKNNLEEIPKQFQIGKIVNQSKSINFGNIDNNTKSTSSGSTSVSKSKKRTRKKPSLITSMLKDDKGWVNKRYNEIQSEKTKGSKGWYQRQLKKRKRVTLAMLDENGNPSLIFQLPKPVETVPLREPEGLLELRPVTDSEIGRSKYIAETVDNNNTITISKYQQLLAD